MGRFLLFLSIIPVYLVGLYVYRKDNEKEPKKLLKRLFLGGVGSCFLAIILTFVLSFIFPIISSGGKDLNLIQLLFYVFIGVALLEEFSKWIMVFKISYKNENFDELYDIIVYSVFVSLGFACFENILYVLSGGIGVGIARALFAIPGHAADGVFMGYYLGKAKQNSVTGNKVAERKYIILSIIVPTILHGIYDYCLFSKETILIFIFFIFIIVLYIISIKTIKKISKSNTYIGLKNRYCGNCGARVNGKFCNKCGHENS